MQPQEFLAAVLPTAGHYCSVELSTKKRQHVFVDDLLALEETIGGFDAQSKNTYFALSTFTEPGSREAANACFVRSLFIDIDTGAGAKVYPTKREAVSALEKFLTETKLGALGSPWVVDSGGGVHAYWPLTKDATIAEWAPVAEAFKRKAKELAFRIDMTVTADAARILRPPGTNNYKYTPTRPVTLKFRGDIFELGALAAALDVVDTPEKTSTALALPGKRPSIGTALSPTMAAMTQNSITLFKNIMVKTVAGSGCGQLAHYVEHATEDGMEPLWRGLLSIATKCDDGEKAVVRLSALHPYDMERMHRKLAEIKGPYACVKLDSENPGVCGECAHWGKITNPLALGRVTALDDTEKEYAPQPDKTSSPGAHLIRPKPPRGYSYGSNGGVYALRNVATDGEETQKEIMLLPFDFFMIDMLQEGNTYMSRFAAVRAKSVVYVTIPNQAAGSKDEVIKKLASQNIIAAFGTGNDKNLFDYVRTCVGEASATDTSLRVPPNLGWQPDGGFAISDQVILPHAQTYTYVSDKLTNIINATSTKGTLGDWQRVMNMLQLKEQFGVLTMAAIGFGSPLMQWVDEGTPGIVFHACGRQSGAGKSLGLSACASVWGSPAHYPVKPTTSGVTMLQRAGLLGNCPLLIDEVTSNSHKTNREWMPEFAFGYSQGGHKLKGSGASNSELDNSLFWRAMAIVTSNAPEMEHMMGARDTSSEGEVRRMLEWHVEEKIQWTDPEREVLQLLGTNYGTAGRKYALWLVEHTDTAKEVLAEVQKKWRAMVRAEDAERFWNSGCSAILAGSILAGPKYANVFAFDTHAIAKFLKDIILQARAIIRSNQQSAEDIIDNYTREYHGQFVKLAPEQHGLAVLGDGKVIGKDSAKGRIAGRIEYDVNPGWIDYYIEVGTLKRYCATRNWSYTELVKRLKETLVVVEGRKNLLAKTNGPVMNVKVLKVSKQINAEDLNL